MHILDYFSDLDLYGFVSEFCREHGPIDHSVHSFIYSDSAPERMRARELLMKKALALSNDEFDEAVRVWRQRIIEGLAALGDGARPRDYRRIPLYGHDSYSRMRLPKLEGLVSEEARAAVIDFSSQVRAAVYRWVLRGLPLPMAIRKAQFDLNIEYYGNGLKPKQGEHDLILLVCEAVCRLPVDVCAWLLHDTRHIFIGGSGQLGQFIHLSIATRGREGGRSFVPVRVIFLSEQLRLLPREIVLWVVAHEIAHSLLNYLGDEHHRNSYLECERDVVELKADALAEQWGFQPPPGPAARLEEQRLKCK